MSRAQLDWLLKRLGRCLLLACTLLSVFAADSAAGQDAGEADFQIPQFEGQPVDKVLLDLVDLGVAYEFVDDPACQGFPRTVISQIPKACPPGATCPGVNKDEVKFVLFTDRGVTVPDLSTEIPNLGQATAEQVAATLQSKGFLAQIKLTHRDVHGNCAEGRDYTVRFDGIVPPANSQICARQTIDVIKESYPQKIVIMGKCNKNGLDCVCY